MTKKKPQSSLRNTENEVINSLFCIGIIIITFSELKMNNDEATGKRKSNILIKIFQCVPSVQTILGRVLSMPIKKAW